MPTGKQGGSKGLGTTAGNRARQRAQRRRAAEGEREVTAAWGQKRGPENLEWCPSGVQSTEFPQGWDRTRLRHLAVGGAGTALAQYQPPKSFTRWPQQSKPPICLSSPPFPGGGPLISHNWNPLWPLSTAPRIGFKVAVHAFGGWGRRRRADGNRSEV